MEKRIGKGGQGGGEDKDRMRGKGRRKEKEGEGEGGRGREGEGEGEGKIDLNLSGVVDSDQARSTRYHPRNGLLDGHCNPLPAFPGKLSWVEVLRRSCLSTQPLQNIHCIIAEKTVRLHDECIEASLFTNL